MEVWHRIAFNGDATPEFTAALDGMGIKYKTSPLPGLVVGLVYFDIAESDPHWKDVVRLVRTNEASDVFQTHFTEKEILNAQWLRLVPVFEQSYPQPEETWVTDPPNYEDHCPQCGTFRQVTSFSLKEEPRLGTHAFMSLFWTYALFCIPQVVHELEAHEIQGYEVWDAIIHTTRARSKGVSQLFIPHIAGSGLVLTEELNSETCPLCGVTRYYPHKRGTMHFRQDALVRGVDIMQTHEWFGSGHSAYREILVSSKFARLVLDQGWKGVALKVIELV